MCPTISLAAASPSRLSSGRGVVSGSFTLQYNPSLLAISGVATKIPGATFTVILTPINPTLATAVLSFSSPSPISTTATPITLGSLLATVPLSATASYAPRRLLHFSSATLNGTGGPMAITNQDGVEVAAYFGDVDETGGPLTRNDASAISTTAAGVPSTAAQTIPGFAAYPNIDPAIIGDVSLQGIVNSTDAGAMLQEVGAPPRITIPYAPIGLAVTPVVPDATFSVATNLAVPQGNTMVVPVTIEMARLQARMFYPFPEVPSQPTPVQLPQASQLLQTNSSAWSVGLVGQALGNRDQTVLVGLDGSVLEQEVADPTDLDAYFAKLAGNRGHSLRF